MSLDSNLFDKLILEGGMEFAGVDSDGEILYSFTQKLAEIDPDLHNRFMSRLREDISALWVNGFVEVDMTASDPLVVLTELAFDKEKVASLDSGLIELINNLKQAQDKL